MIGVAISRSVVSFRYLPSLTNNFKYHRVSAHMDLANSDNNNHKWVPFYFACGATNLLGRGVIVTEGRDSSFKQALVVNFL